MIKRYETFIKVDKEYQPAPGVELHRKLGPGTYRVDWDPRSDQVTFVEIQTNHDKLVNLPDTEYELVMRDVETFLTPECTARFEEMGFLQKMNVLLYGKPGTGKTCLVNRVAQRVIESGGIVLFNPNPASLKTTYDVLDSIQPDTRVLVIFEEMDEHVRNDEVKLLHVLDGEVQKKNAMYIATTNYINQVPTRVRRPGRFSSVIEVGFPNQRAREAYLSTKLKDSSLVKRIASKTKGFSIDELKEVVRGFYCMGKDLESYIKYVGDAAKKARGDLEKEGNEDWEEQMEDVNDTITSALRSFVGKKMR